MASTAGTTASSLANTPTSEDLAETSEVKFTKEIKDLAENNGKPNPKTRLGSFADELYTWYEKLEADVIKVFLHAM